MMIKVLQWFKDAKELLYGIIVVLVLFLFVFIKGCNYGKTRVHCPEIRSDTILVHDTITHTIIDTFPYYIAVRDTIFFRDTIYGDIDTAQILKNYFAVNVYTRSWQDSLLDVTLQDYISENKPVRNVFTYKILRPQQVIINEVDNSITYNKYLYGGITLPVSPFKNINYISLDVIYAFPKGYFGAMWQPEINTFSAKFGVKLLQWHATGTPR